MFTFENPTEIVEFMLLDTPIKCLLKIYNHMKVVILSTGSKCVIIHLTKIRIIVYITNFPVLEFLIVR